MFQCGVTVGVRLRLGGCVGRGRVQEEHRRQSAQQARHISSACAKNGCEGEFGLSSFEEVRAGGSAVK